MMIHKKIRNTLTVIEVFVALGAVAGGIALLTGAIPASLDVLHGSPFVDYTIPAVILAVGVGGSMFLAAATIRTGRERGVLVSAFAGLVMMIFEIVEVAVIDRVGESGFVIGLILQAVYFALGLAILVLSSSLWITENRMHHSPSRYSSHP